MLTIAAALIAGCGGSTPLQSTTSTSTGTTSLTVLATSTANGQLSKFDLSFDAITLTSQSGKTVNLLPGYEHDEFIHLNGRAEPLFTVNVPDDTYTAATATIGPATYSCFSGNSGGTVSGSTFAYGYTPDSHVTVNLPSGIRVSGASMVLSLDLQVSQSASWSSASCTTFGPGDSFLITPTFNLTTRASSSQSAMNGLAGMVAAVDAAGNSFTVSTDGGTHQEVTSTGSTVTSNAPVWRVGTTKSTVFQGISGSSALLPGMPVDMDAALQADGSLLATRVAVYDTTDTNMVTLSESAGPLVSVLDGPLWSSLSAPVLLAGDTEGEGEDAATEGGWIDAAGFSFENAAFQTSGQLSNLQQLPCPAQFDAANAAAGQTISFTFNGNNISNSTQLTTVTLTPQAINGTVTAVSSAGGFDMYTVSLAAYDLFPQLAVQTYQTTVLSNPSVVVVYADSSTQSLNTMPIVVGSVLRFYGLVFNDSGTLRMDCAQINDGVPE
jgi:hypothetical protein